MRWAAHTNCRIWAAVSIQAGPDMQGLVKASWKRGGNWNGLHGRLIRAHLANRIKPIRLSKSRIRFLRTAHLNDPLITKFFQLQDSLPRTYVARKLNVKYRVDDLHLLSADLINSLHMSRVRKEAEESKIFNWITIRLRLRSKLLQIFTCPSRETKVKFPVSIPMILVNKERMKFHSIFCFNGMFNTSGSYECAKVDGIRK